jgi:hypothetical protein
MYEPYVVKTSRVTQRTLKSALRTPPTRQNYEPNQASSSQHTIKHGKFTKNIQNPAKIAKIVCEFYLCECFSAGQVFFGPRPLSCSQNDAHWTSRSERLGDIFPLTASADSASGDARPVSVGRSVRDASRTR